MADPKFESKSIKVNFGETMAYTFSMSAKDLIHIYYVATRGKDQEEGAVQRPLSTRRIESIKDYILDGNTFFNSFIVNWTAKKTLVKFSNDKVSFPLTASAAQALDGQHRLAGLERAIEDDPSVEDRNLLVTLCVGLDTKTAAGIFLNINTEQKPVPKSLIFDLFGIVEDNPENAIVRAKDIAQKLNDDDESPLNGLIKFPGQPRGVGKIELSTFVSSLKKSLEKDGVFKKYKIRTFENQYSVISNYFESIKSVYVNNKVWASQKNPFLVASGFNGAIDFLISDLIAECAARKSFKIDSIINILDLDETDLLARDDLKNLDGKTARKRVAEYLEGGILRKKTSSDDSYEF